MTRTSRTDRALAALLIAGLWACSDDDPAPVLTDAGASADAAAPSDADAGPGDASAGDALPIGDAGTSTQARPADACNPVAQDCADGMERCVIEPRMPGGGTACIDRRPDDKALGAVCGGSDCEAGLVCVRTATVGRCLLACDRMSGAPCSTLGTDVDCRLTVRGTNWGACERLEPICDALTLAPCRPDQACQPIRRFDGSFELRCNQPGAGRAGDRCEMSGCERGLICVREEGMSFCRLPCGDDSGCAMPQRCLGVVVGVKYCR